MRWEQRAFFDCYHGKLKTYPAFDMDGQMIQICAYPNDDHGIQQQKCFKPPLISMSGKLSLCNVVLTTDYPLKGVRNQYMDQ